MIFTLAGLSQMKRRADKLVVRPDKIKKSPSEVIKLKL